MAKQQGRLGHGYEIRVQHADRFLPDYHLVWGIDDKLPEEWSQFQRENVGNPAIRSAQIYRNTECRKNMAHRHIRDEYVG